MVAVASLLVVLALSILITRIATVALTLTGLSHEAARFQARSAFTGVGFTTSESERVVNHPIRRRVLLLLMLLGNAGIVTALASLILSLIDGSGGSLGWRMALLAGGVALLWGLAASPWLNRWLSNLISRAVVEYEFGDFEPADSGRAQRHLRRIERRINRLDRKVKEFEKKALSSDHMVSGTVQMQRDMERQFRKIAGRLKQVIGRILARRDGRRSGQ